MSTAVYTPEGCVPLGKAVVFDAHREYNRDGKLVREFSENRLQEICDINNELIEKRGHFSPLGPGHNIMPEEGERVPQALYPPIWGWAGGFRVEGHPRDPNTACIVVDTYAKTTREPDGNGKMIDPATEIKRYPFASVEIHQTDGDGKPIAGRIGRIACLREDSRRDLGPMLCYSKSAGVHEGRKTRAIYADQKQNRQLAASERGSVLFYAMGMGDNMAMPLAMDPTADANAGAPGMDDIENIIEAIKVRYPKLAALMVEEPAAPDPMGDPLAGPPLDAPGGDLPLPGGGDAPGGDAPMPDNKPALFSKAAGVPEAKRGEQAYWEKENAALRSRLDALEAARKNEAETARLDFAKLRARRIQAAGKKIHYDKVVLRFSKMTTDKDRDEYEQELMDTSANLSHYDRAPTGGFIPTADAPRPTLQYSRAAAEAATEECRLAGKMDDDSYKAALEKHKALR